MKKPSLLKKLGPGLITGASDDDPSGILTYLQGGVMLGLGSLWTMLFTLPMMCTIQEMAGRIGLVTDEGIAQIIKKNYSKLVLYSIIFVSALVLVINIGADLLAIGTAISGMIPVSNYITLPLTAALIIFCTVYFPYKRFEETLKWLTLSLLFYVLAVLYLNINWMEAIRGTFIPHMSFSKNSILLIAAIFGTTVSPYLFFWQTNEEIEDKMAHKEKSSLPDETLVKHEIKDMREDVSVGMTYSNVVAWFIIAGAAAMASSSGITSIGNFSEASLVLRPLLGEFAYFAFVIGIVGSGLLVIPVLAGSIGYMFAEAFDWERGINKKFKKARGFYGVIIISTVIGLLMDFIGLDPVTLLVYTAVLYTVITPPIIYIVLKIANNRKIMGDWVNSKLSNFFGVITLAVSTVLVVAYLYTLFV